ncbi:very short patch repair endonuclease [Zobellella sp. An-6]|uniref:very short patch repair endonuclease n=1 Tax=Zobellella sp. An-6 TaxID=3400218 RepID=UPI004041965C
MSDIVCSWIHPTGFQVNEPRHHMADKLTREERSRLMSRIGSKGSSAEMKLRRLIHSMGFRYRLHVKGLPGTPDMVFPRRRAVIFMHSCFWHRHEGCRMATEPKSNREYWLPKLEENRRRDLRQRRQLQELGWRVLVVWECELRDLEKVARSVRDFLEASSD